MRNDRKEFEILAPAGSREAMVAAAAAGADAVYFGLGALDMRSLATGAFGEADLPEIAAFAKETDGLGRALRRGSFCGSSYDACRQESGH